MVESIDEFSKEELEMIFKFDEEREIEKEFLKEQLLKTKKELNSIEVGEDYRRAMNLEIQKDQLEELIAKLTSEGKKESYQKIYHLSRQELIVILDDFIQYKDYFENPPKEAYEVDDYDYCQCREAHELEKLLYKYEIYDKTCVEKLPIIEKMYNRRTPAELSREELKLDEIISILTWLHREERWCGGYFNEAIEEKTFYYFLKRMEQIKNEL